MNRRARGRRRHRVVSLSYQAARAFIRTCGPQVVPPLPHRFSLGVRQGGRLVGVAVVTRPADTLLDDGKTAEMTRLCPEASPCACRALLSGAWRIARAMGYQQMITYARPGRPVRDLRAAGWRQGLDGAPRTRQGASGRSRHGGASREPLLVLWRITAAGNGRRRPRDGGPLVCRVPGGAARWGWPP